MLMVLCPMHVFIAFLGHLYSHKLSFVVYSAWNIILAFWFLFAVIVAIQIHLNAEYCRNDFRKAELYQTPVVV